MILFKKQQEYLNHLSQSLSDGLARVQEQLKDLTESGVLQEQQVGELSKTLGKHTGAVEKQGMSLEDLIEMMEEWQEQESQGARRIRELEEEKEALLSVIGDYQETIWQLKAAVPDQDPPWLSQLAMAEDRIRNKMEHAGMDAIGREGEAVDYDFHDIITVEDTDNKALHGTVKQVFSPGYRFRGRVVRKCRISAWRSIG